MTKVKHTPGPWEEVTPADDLWPPRVFAGSAIICMVDNSDMAQGEKLANARVIAAAPKMLEALEALMDINDNGGPFGGEMYHDRVNRTWDTARAAIAKATGETQ